VPSSDAEDLDVSKCLRCGAGAEWIEGTTVEPSVAKRERANARARLSTVIRRLHGAAEAEDLLGSDSIRRILPALHAARRALGGKP